jgi:hypothetical protein
MLFTVNNKILFSFKGDENELFTASVRVDCKLHCSLDNKKKIQENTQPRIDYSIHSLCYINCHLYRAGNGSDKKIYKFYSSGVNATCIIASQV